MTLAPALKYEDLVIQQLKTYCPSFNGNVAGVAELANAKTKVNLPLPSAYVASLGYKFGEEESETASWQVVTYSFNVIVILDNSVDPRGQAASEIGSSDIFWELTAALKGWRLDPNRMIHAGVSGVSASYVNSDNLRLYYQYIWSFDFVINEEDGFEVAGEPIAEIDYQTGTTFDNLEGIFFKF